MIKKELSEELTKQELRLLGYTLLTCFDKNTKDLPICDNCQVAMFKDFLEFLKKWELVSESLYKKLSDIITEASEGDVKNDTCQSENERSRVCTELQ